MLLLTLVLDLALVCSSSDLKLDHWCLELEMKGGSFVLNRLLVLRTQNWVGMGFTFCVCVRSQMHFHTCVCVKLFDLPSDFACQTGDR